MFYAHPTGRIQSFLDRAFYAARPEVFMFKPAASVVVARRGGSSSSFDVLNKYATIASMPLVSSTYWNMVYGRRQGEVQQDEEGMQTMRNLGHNMAWTIRCIEAGEKAGYPHPAPEHGAFTNFVR